MLKTIAFAIMCAVAPSSILANHNPEDILQRINAMPSLIAETEFSSQSAQDTFIEERLVEINNFITELNFYKELNNMTEYRLPNEIAPPAFVSTGPVSYEYKYIKPDGSFWTTNDFQTIIEALQFVKDQIQ